MDQFSGTQAGDINLDDRRWALLCYLFTPIVPLMLLLVESVRDRPFVKANLPQALVLGAVQAALLILTPFTFCVSTIGFLLLYTAIFFWGFQAYNGNYVNIPLVTDYVRKQGWI